MDYYTIRESTVNLCFLDTSKAFDKVNHYGLYIKLMKSNVQPILLHVIINWYSKCTAVVKGHNVLPYGFQLKCGVRQGVTSIVFCIH